MFPRIEFDFDVYGIWTVTLKGPTKTSSGRHWFITVAFAKAAWEYWNDK